MAAGDVLILSEYRFVLEGVTEHMGANYKAHRAQMTVYKPNGQRLTVLQPEKRTYFSSTMPLTETAIYSTAWRDLYVAMTAQQSNGRWLLHVYDKPHVVFIWWGGIFMVLGGLLAVSDARYRRSVF